MSRRVQDEKPARDAGARAWLEQSVADQRRRHEAIAKEMDELEPTRRRWYEEFLEIIQRGGFNVTGDIRRKIQPDELPARPDRKDRVVY